MKDKKKIKNERLGVVGGQAVLEGVMMKSKDRMSLAVRDESGNIKVKNTRFTSVRKKHKILNIPIIRGCVNFVEMMILSYSTLEDSAKMLGMDNIDEETKFDRWLKKKLGDKLMNVVMGIAMVLGIVFAFALFTILPAFITKLVGKWTSSEGAYWLNFVSGGIRIIIFIIYMLLVSLMKDIRRTFEYHGAEHKSIACYEAGLELTPENAEKCTRFHPRCGTSFIFVVMIISILIFSVVKWDMNFFAMIALRLCLLPVVVGISFEFLMLAGKHPNKLTLALSYPGLLMQRITTKNPDRSQLEVAIKALKNAMPDVFPEDYEGDWTEADEAALNNKKADDGENEAASDETAFPDAEGATAESEAEKGKNETESGKNEAESGENE